MAKVGRGGCRPWFVKPLPSHFEIEQGKNIESKCFIGDAFEEEIVATQKEQQKQAPKLKKMEEPPSTPAGVHVIMLSATSASIEWMAPYNNGGAALLHYILEKRESTDEPWEMLTTLPPCVTECELENMSPGKNYEVRICAENKYGQGSYIYLNEPISIKGSKRAPPSKPGKPQVVQVIDTSVTLTWECSIDDGGSPVSHYILEKREVRGPRWVRVHKSSIKEPPHIVTNLADGSKYEFRVYAKNAIGVSEPSEMSRPLCITDDIECPKFVGEMSDVSVEEGDRAVFKCHMEGNPTPDIRWFKNFREIFDGYKHKVSQDGDVCELLITNVALEDVGEVECRAFNKAGTATIRANLSLLIAAKIKSSRLCDEMSFSRGHTIKIRVPMVGRPYPKTTWIKDGEVLEENERVEITSSETQATLLVHDCEKSDTGQYCVIVENKLNRDSIAYKIIVTDRPDAPPGKPLVSEVSKTSARVSWQAPAHDGGAVITAYIIEKCEKGSRKWLKCGSTHLTNMQIHRLKENREYCFRIVAENAHGLSEPSEESEAVLTQEEKLQVDYDKLVLLDHQYVNVNTAKLGKDIESKYIICEEIGRGAFGIVFRAIERATGRNWAMKFISCGAIEKQLIRREIDLMNELHHPLLLQLHEVFDLPGEMALVLEFLAGGDLFEKLVDNEFTLTEEDVITYMRQVTQAVNHMHIHNIIHLDIKPENVVFTTRDSQDVKIIDFGLSQKVDPERSVRALFGTAEFCAPELINYEPVSFASDMWSLGVMAYILLTGMSPFQGPTPDDTFLYIMAGELNFSTPVWDKISQHAKDWIQKVLVKQTEGRMTVRKALGHPWLNGEAEAELHRTPLPTDRHKLYFSKQQWRVKHDDALAIGHLAHQSPLFMKISGKEIAFERELVMELPDLEPQVVLEMTNTEVYEGTVARFKCKFQGKPEPHISWYYEGLPLSEEDGKYTFWYKRGLAMLNINDVRADDGGQYSCLATNNVGTCSTMGELAVQEMVHRRSSVDGFGGGGRRRRSVSHDRERLSLTSRSASMETLNTVYDSNIPPQFVLPLLDQIVTAGDRCTLSLQVTCKPEPEVQWFLNDSRVLGDGWYSIESEHGVHRLTIPSVKAEDGGTWRCLASNVYGQTMCSGKVEVLGDVPKYFLAPTFSLPVCKSIVFEGSNTRLECKVSGAPEPEVVWLKNHQALPDDLRYMSGYDPEDESYSLYISETYREDTATYTCYARNAAGTAFSEAQLVVECLDYDSIYEISRSRRSSMGSVQSDLESVCTRTSRASSASSRRKNRADTAPNFTAKLRAKKCDEGQTVRFNASISGLPMPDVAWFRGNRVITEGGRFHFSNNYGLLSLEITKVKREDAGIYTVKAQNIEGEVACSAPLDVQELETYVEKKDGTKKPWFVVEAQNTWAEVGGRATFEAQASGAPVPAFRWQRDNINLVECDRVRVFTDELGHVKLVVKNVTHADAGLYFCIADNKTGKAKCAATLRVVDKGQLEQENGGRASRETTPLARRRRSMSRDTTPVAPLPERKQLPTGNEPWFIQKPPSTMNCHEGEPLTLKAVIDGDPKPTVTWLKEPHRELTYSKRHRVVVSNGHHMMEITSAVQTDAGRFICMAENEYGRVAAATFVNMLPPRAQADDDLEAKAHFIKLPEYDYEIELNKERGKMAPLFTKRLPISKEVEQGSNLEVSCHVEEAETPEYTKDFEIKTKVTGEASIKTVTIGKGGEVKSTEVTSLSEPAAATEETITATEETPVEAAAPPAETPVAPPADTPAVSAPMFEKGLEDKSVKVGKAVKLSVSVSGSPTPAVSFTKNGQNMEEEGDTYDIGSKDKEHFIEFCDVEADDAGEYACTATNASGTVTTSCKLSIEAPKPPAPTPAPAQQEAPKEAPAEEAPKEEAPKEEAPAEETPKEEAPAEEAPAEEAPKEEAPAEEAPKEEAPAEEAPKEEVPAEEAPKEEAPAEEAPKEEAPKEEAPAEEAPKEVQEEAAVEAPKEESPKEASPAAQSSEEEEESESDESTEKGSDAEESETATEDSEEDSEDSD